MRNSKAIFSVTAMLASSCGGGEAVLEREALNANIDTIEYPANVYEVADREPIVAAPIDALAVPDEIKKYLDANTVSILRCSGRKVFIGEALAGVIFASHCISSDLNEEVIEYHSTNIPFYDGIRRGTGARYEITQAVAYPDIDTIFGSLPGFTPEQVADEYFDQNAQGWESVPAGALVYFSCYPGGQEHHPQNSNRISFVGSYVGSNTTHVYSSPSDASAPQWDVYVEGVATNLAQNGLGGVSGCSGAVMTYFGGPDGPISSGALASYKSLSAGRITTPNQPALTTAQALAKQQEVHDQTGYRVFADLFNGFGDLNNPGDAVQVVFD